jgi:hypothetical protein
LERLLQIPQFALEKVHVLELINVPAMEVTLAHNAKQHLQQILQNHHQNLLHHQLLVLESLPLTQPFVLEKDLAQQPTLVHVTLDTQEINVKP